MNPKYHPAQEQLLEYATGAAPEWLSMMLACHLTLCPQCREELELLEQVGGLLLGQADKGCQPQLRVSPSDAPPAVGSPRPLPPLPQALGECLPWPLQRYLRDDRPSWRMLAPGVRHMPLSLSIGDQPVRLLLLKPGFVIPKHEHAGEEFYMVLDGGIDDPLSGGHYERGDVALNAPGTIHEQHVDRERHCVALVAVTERLIPKTLIGRILAGLTGV